MIATSKFFSKRPSSGWYISFILQPRRVRRYSEDMWPKRGKTDEANVLHASDIGAWNTTYGKVHILTGEASQIPTLQHTQKYKIVQGEDVPPFTPDELAIDSVQ